MLLLQRQFFLPRLDCNSIACHNVTHTHILYACIPSKLVLIYLFELIRVHFPFLSLNCWSHSYLSTYRLGLLCDELIVTDCNVIFVSFGRNVNNHKIMYRIVIVLYVRFIDSLFFSFIYLYWMKGIYHIWFTKMSQCMRIHYTYTRTNTHHTRIRYTLKWNMRHFFRNLFGCFSIAHTNVCVRASDTQRHLVIDTLKFDENFCYIG